MSKRALCLCIALVLPAVTQAAPTPEDDATVHQRLITQQFSVQGIGVLRANGLPLVDVEFAAPVAPYVELDNFLQITSFGGIHQSGHWRISTDRRHAYFNNVEPDGSYWITVKKGLIGENGQALSEDTTQSIKLSSTNSATASSGLQFVSHSAISASQMPRGLPILTPGSQDVEVKFYRLANTDVERFVNIYGYQSSFSRSYSYRWYDIARHAKNVWQGDLRLQTQAGSAGVSFIPLNDKEALARPGLYVAEITSSGGSRYRDQRFSWFVVSNLNIDAHVHPPVDLVTTATLEVASIRDGKPAADVKVHAVGELDSDSSYKQRLELASMTTDDGGRVTFKEPDEEVPYRLFWAQRGHDIAVVRVPALGKPAQDAGRQLFLFSPVISYRPGEHVELSALMRDEAGKPASHTLTAKLVTETGSKELGAFTPGKNGYYHLAFDLDKTLQAGRASVVVNDIWRYNLLINAKDSSRLQLSAPSQIRSDALPWQVKLTTDEPAGVYRGLPENQLEVAPQRHPYPHWNAYSFGYGSRAGLLPSTDIYGVSFDTNGEAHLNIDTEEPPNAPLHFVLNTSLKTSAGLIKASAETNIVPTQAMIGIEPLFADNALKVPGLADFNIIKTRGDKALAAKGLEVRLIRILKDHYWGYQTYRDHGSQRQRWSRGYIPRELVVKTQKLDLGPQPTPLRVQVDAGDYRLEIRDPHNNAFSRYAFHVNGSPKTVNRASIKLTPDKERYRPGETVHLQIKAPATGRGLLRVEQAGELLYSKNIEVEEQGGTAIFKLDPQWPADNLYASVELIQPDSAGRSDQPKLMSGDIAIPMDASVHTLAISSEKLSPNACLQGEVTIPLNVSLNQQPVGDSQVVMSVASASGAQADLSPMDFFYPPLAYPIVRLSTQAPQTVGKHVVRPDISTWADTRQLVQGANDKTQLASAKIAYFSAPVTVDKNGNATVKVKLPASGEALTFKATAYLNGLYGQQSWNINTSCH